MAECRTSIDIAAPPKTVFAHLVTPERMVAWMGERADLEARPGGRFAIDIGSTPFRGEYLELDESRRVVLSWGLAGSYEFPPGSSRVEFTLEPTPSGTTLHLVHSGLPQRTNARMQPVGATLSTDSSMPRAATFQGLIESFDEDGLRSILATDLVFEGSLAGHRVGAEGFIRGVRDVAAALRSFRGIQRLEQGDAVAALAPNGARSPPAR